MGGTGLTSKQLSNLLSLLNKSDGSTENKENTIEDANNLISNGKLAGTFCFVSKNVSNYWIIDSRATDHMCNSISLFKNLKNIDGSRIEVLIPDGSKLRITKIGDISLNNNLVLKDVLYVPKIRFNLISVHKLCTDNYISLIFSSFGCWFQD